MRLYLDEDLSPKIAKLLKGQGIDAVSVHDVGSCGLSDQAQLDRAAAEGRALVTRNRDDFIRLTLQFLEAGRPHAGVLILSHSLPPDRFSAIAKALERYHSGHLDGLPPYTVDFVGRA